MIERIVEISIPISFAYEDEVLSYNTYCDFTCLFCRHESSTRFGRLLTKTKCPGCARKLPWDEKEVYDVLNQDGITVLELTGIKKADRIKMHCGICSNVWSTSIQSVFHNGTRCPNCVVNQRKRDASVEMTRIINKINSLGNSLILVSHGDNLVETKCKVCDTIQNHNYASFLQRDFSCINCHYTLKKAISQRIRYEKRLSSILTHKGLRQSSKLKLPYYC